ncbi:O-antigen ligase [Conyzicola lurida]|uniref:O-antigen ligase n=1 Tax=Conyzicola lurida TaxID=1172621 RepID=A0A841AS93_9MICO|nr:O-antigen ligase family protein [Conyzicola lurida]MBB5845134.1 O-antigen ligase [Conyzicola lurida]
MTAPDPLLRRSVVGPPEHPPLDAVSFLTVFLVLLFAVPAGQSVTALGSVGSPALLWATAGGLWWCWHQLQRGSERNPGNPVRIAAFVYLAAVTVSYAGAMFRGLPSSEASPADTGLVKVFAWIGLVLLVSDGIPNYERLLTLVRRACLAAGLLGLLGLLQFATGLSLIDWLQIPGLSTNADSALQVRSGFARSSGTASHPLEYGFVLSTMMPVALTLALWDTGRPALRRWLPVLFIVLAAALAVSRSTLLGLAMGMLVLIPTWSGRMRLIALGAAGVLVAGVYLLVPGMVGTIRGLFGGEDSSTSSRIGSYDLVGQFVARSPVIGRGPGTFLPEYRILDNQLLQSAIEIGVLGIVALLALSGAAVVSGLVWRGEHRPELPRRIGHGLGAASAVGAVLLATFDVFAFPMATGIFFLVIGMAGANYRLRGTAADQTGASTPTARARPIHQRDIGSA